MSRLHNTRFLGRGDLRSKVARSKVEKKNEKMEGKIQNLGDSKMTIPKTIVTIQNEMVNIF